MSCPAKSVNLGVFGYGSEQQLIGLAQYLEAHPTAAIGDVVVLVLDNDMRDVEVAYQRYLGRSKPCFKVSGGRLVQPPYEPSWSDHLMDVSYLYWLLNGKRSFYLGTEPPADSVAGIETVLSCLAAMREMATGCGRVFM